MPQKTPKTALVLIPPAEVWPRIQTIREKHDPHVKRWMPHITLLYPFRPRDQFDTIALRLSAACALVKPFKLTLNDFRIFDYGRGSYTLWLAPEPDGAVIRLHSELLRVLPDCDDTMRYKGGFIPHLSVGVLHGEKVMSAVRKKLQKHWNPISFTVDQVSLIWRNDPPDDAFRLDRTIPLAKPKGNSSLPSQ